jgi:phage terminase large subunit
MEAAAVIASPYAPRKQFMGLHTRQQRWGIAVCHRRAGKTVACVNDLIKAAACCGRTNGRFAYIAPQLNQAKDIAWQYLLEYTDCFGPERKVNASELWVELPNNGARIRIYGADNPDRLRGIYLDGAVLDEFGDMDPTVWSQVIRPALSDRKGWAVFIGTPKGKNTFHTLWVNAGDDPDWFTLNLKASETGLLDLQELADAARMMSEDEFAQEYECSFDAAVRGAYYGKEMNDAGDRIASVPYDPRLPVHTAWDLGVADSTVIWFLQVAGRETRVIDVLKGEGVGLDWYAKRLQERDYLWGNHYLPHDVEVRELGTGKTRKEVLAGFGIKATVCPNIPIADGIQAVRMLLPTCWFDKDKCKDGIEALRMYRREYDDKRQEFRVNPLHDWTSHYADAFRYFAVGHRDKATPKDLSKAYAARMRAVV